jgi:hypothetical protein
MRGRTRCAQQAAVSFGQLDIERLTEKMGADKGEWDEVGAFDGKRNAEDRQRAVGWQTS